MPPPIFIVLHLCLLGSIIGGCVFVGGARLSVLVETIVCHGTEAAGGYVACDAVAPDFHTSLVTSILLGLGLILGHVAAVRWFWSVGAVVALGALSALFLGMLSAASSIQLGGDLSCVAPEGEVCPVPDLDLGSLLQLSLIGVAAAVILTAATLVLRAKSASTTSASTTR